MTRPSFRDVTYVGTLLINGIVLCLNLWALWLRPDAVSSIVVVIVCLSILMTVRARDWTDAYRATQLAAQHKYDAETQVAEAMLAHIRQASAVTWSVETPRAERRH